MAKSKAKSKPKPKGRPPKANPQANIDWRAMAEAVNAETVIARGVERLSKALADFGDVKIEIILGACNYSERRLLLQTLLLTMPRETIDLNMRAIRMASPALEGTKYGMRMHNAKEQNLIGCMA